MSSAGNATNCAMLEALIVNQATSGRLSGLTPGSPNLLLYLE